VLHKEFGVPFVVYDAAGGAVVYPVRERPSSWENGTGSVPVLPLEACRVKEMARAGTVQVCVDQPGVYQLTATLHQGGRAAFVAAAGFQGLARTEAEAATETAYLSRWLQSVADRLRLADQLTGQRTAVDEHQAQAKAAWEGLLSVDQLIRRLRVHKEPERNRRRIVEAAYELLDVRTLAFIPPDRGAPTLLHGESLLTPDDFTALAGWLAKCPDFKEDAAILFNPAQLKTQSWPCAATGTESLLAFPVLQTHPTGWLIALDKGKRAGPSHTRNTGPLFRRSDAVLLMPFVGLLRMQYAASQRYTELRELVVGMARALTAALDAKDTYTYGHSERVARVGVELGKTLGLSADTLHDIYLAGLLHDVGYIGVPDAVLAKPGPLTPDEFEQVKKHVRIGYNILADLRPIRALLPGILHHHERWDGGGYPSGLAGDKIPLLARILAVADSFDAMSAERPYRPALAAAAVEQALRDGAGSQWDPQVVEAFLKCKQKVQAIRQRGIGESLRQAIDGALRTEGSTNII
jgi:hypothetical protein